MFAVSAMAVRKGKSGTDGSAGKSLLGEEMTLCQRISHMYAYPRLIFCRNTMACPLENQLGIAIDCRDDDRRHNLQLLLKSGEVQLVNPLSSTSVARGLTYR